MIIAILSNWEDTNIAKCLKNILPISLEEFHQTMQLYRLKLSEARYLEWSCTKKNIRTKTENEGFKIAKPSKEGPVNQNAIRLS